MNNPIYKLTQAIRKLTLSQYSILPVFSESIEYKPMFADWEPSGIAYNAGKPFPLIAYRVGDISCSSIGCSFQSVRIKLVCQHKCDGCDGKLLMEQAFQQACSLQLLIEEEIGISLNFKVSIDDVLITFSYKFFHYNV